MVTPAVVSMSPEMAAFAPDMKIFLPWSFMVFLPAAMRTKPSGMMNRTRATMRSCSSSPRGVMSAYGVPGMGVRKLTGMDLMPSAAMSMYMSIRSSMVSPSPMMPPLQTSSPASSAHLMVCSLSSYVWVVQTFGKLRREVSRLLW